MTDKLEQHLPNQEQLKAAANWHLQLSDDNASAATWEAFAAWLEANNANRLAYEAIIDADSGLDVLPPNPSSEIEEPSFANDNPVSTFRKWLGPGAVATALALLVALFMVSPWQQSKLTDFVTAPGESRIVSLDDGSNITLNGDTRLTVDLANRRFARLDSGEAMFQIKHDASRPFTVESGAVIVRDVGTVFNVRRNVNIANVSVAEGAVVVNPDIDAISLTVGQMVTLGNGKAIVRSIDPANVTGWTRGQLVYDNEPLQYVVADVARLSGTPMQVDPAIAKRNYSGTIFVEEKGEALAKKLELLLGLNAHDSEQGWLFGP